MPEHVHSRGPADIRPVAHVTPVDPGPDAPDAAGPRAWPGSVPSPRGPQGPQDPQHPQHPRGQRGPRGPRGSGGAQDAGFGILDWQPADASSGHGGPAGPEPGGSAPPYEEVPRAEGIGYRFSSLGHIFGHSRMGMWRRRLLIALAVFIVCVIFLNWQVGLTLAVLAVIADTVLRARTVAPAPVASVRKPTKPQRMTQKQLLGLQKAGYRALHSRLIPGSEEHIDHLVVGPAGVFAIDSEWWDKHLPIRTKNARQLWLGPFSMKERLEHARWESDQATALISATLGGQVPVRPVMAVYGPKIPWDVTTIRDVDVFSGKRLRTYLRRYARQNNTSPLTPAEVDRIFRAAHEAFPSLDPGIPAPPLPAAPK